MRFSVLQFAMAALVLLGTGCSKAAEKPAAPPAGRAGSVETEQDGPDAERGRGGDAEDKLEADDDPFLRDLIREAATFGRLREEKFEFVSLFANGYGQDAPPAEYEAWCTRHLTDSVLQITGEKDLRTGVERILQCYLDDEIEHWLKRHAALRETSESDTSRVGWDAKEFATHVAVCCGYMQAADERLKEHVLRPERRGEAAWQWLGAPIYLMAIDAYQDDRSCEILLHYASRPSRYSSWDKSEWALAFLRAYDPEKVRPRIEAALREMEKDPQDTWAWKNRRDSLQRLIRSLHYAQSLSPEEREAYHYFERSLWHSEALLPHGGMIRPVGSPDWKVGNERFLVHCIDAGVARVAHYGFWKDRRFREALPPESIEEFKRILQRDDLSETARREIEAIVRAGHAS
jgi:hypothetical protein